MPSFAALLKDEMRRIAKREVRAMIAVLRKDNARLKRTAAEHKRRLAELEKSVGRLASETAPIRAEAARATQEELQKARITPRVIRNLRKRLGLSQAQFAKLVGVSGQSVYYWEHKEGRLTLREETKAAIMQARKLGVREARRRLEEMEGS